MHRSIPVRQPLIVGLIILLPFILVGALLGGTMGAILGIAVGLIVQAIAYAISRRVILRITDATIVDETAAPHVVAMVCRLAERAGIQAPVVAISQMHTPNAFAVATPGGGLIGVTSGLLDMLTPNEVEAVLAHEVAHLLRRDRVGVTIAAVFATLPGAITSASGADLFYDRPFRRRMHRAWGGRYLRPLRDAIAFVSLPFGAVLVRCAVSPRDELRADAIACTLVGDPQPLVSALRKINALAGRVAMPLNPAISPMLLIHPFGPERVSRWFNTHPSLAERLANVDATSASRD